MPSPAFHSPRSIADAVAMLAADSGARVLSGGTDLIVQMQSQRIAPSAVIDIKRIDGMIGVRSEAGGFIIGAATPCTASRG